MPTTILDNETYPEALQRRYAEETKAEKQAEIIRMANEACQPHQILNTDLEFLIRFAAIVAEHWIETNKALAKEIIELKKQAEQEPVGYFAYDEEHDIWEELTGPNAPGATKLYTAPVRTKDLTDDEIVEAVGVLNGFDAFRAVIATDREKNK